MPHKGVELLKEHRFGEWHHAVVDRIVVADWSHGWEGLNESAVKWSDQRRHHQPMAATRE